MWKEKKNCEIFYVVSFEIKSCTIRIDTYTNVEEESSRNQVILYNRIIIPCAYSSHNIVMYLYY